MYNPKYEDCIYYPLDIDGINYTKHTNFVYSSMDKDCITFQKYLNYLVK